MHASFFGGRQLLIDTGTVVVFLCLNAPCRSCVLDLVRLVPFSFLFVLKGLVSCALPMPRSLLGPSSKGENSGDSGGGDGSSLGKASSTSGVGVAVPAVRQPRKSPWGGVGSGGGGGLLPMAEDTRTGMEMLSDHVRILMMLVLACLVWYPFCCFVSYRTEYGGLSSRL